MSDPEKRDLVSQLHDANKDQGIRYFIHTYVQRKTSGDGWNKAFSFCGHLDVRAFGGLTDFTCILRDDQQPATAQPTAKIMWLCWQPRDR